MAAKSLDSTGVLRQNYLAIKVFQRNVPFPLILIVRETLIKSRRLSTYCPTTVNLRDIIIRMCIPLAIVR